MTISLIPAQDEDAEYEQLKKDVMANTRRLVLEPFIIATAAAVGLNFGAYVRRVLECARPSCSRVRTGTSNVIYSRRSQAVGRDNLYFPIRKKVKLLVSFACGRCFSRCLQLLQQILHLPLHRLRNTNVIQKTSQMRPRRRDAPHVEANGTSILLWTFSLSRAFRLLAASGLHISTHCLAPVCTTSCEMWFSLSNSSCAAVSDTMLSMGEPLDDLQKY